MMWIQLVYIFFQIFESCFLIATLFVCERVHTKAEDIRCTDDAKMPNLTEKYLQLNFDITTFVHRSFGIHELATKKFFNQQHLSGYAEPVKENRTFIFGASGCRGNKQEFLLQRSTCPWRLMMTTDNDRFPRQMFTAECVCTRCRGRKKSKFQCEPILFPIKVLRQKYKTTGNKIQKVCEMLGNKVIFKYEEVFERIVTGCTCSKILNIKYKLADKRKDWKQAH